MKTLINFFKEHPYSYDSDISVSFNNNYLTQTRDLIIIKLWYNTAFISRIIDLDVLEDEEKFRFILEDMYNSIQNK